MMDALAALEPDVLLLGGDYAAPGLWETLNGMDMENAAVAAQAASDRHLFFSALADFPAPLASSPSPRRRTRCRNSLRRPWPWAACAFCEVRR